MLFKVLFKPNAPLLVVTPTTPWQRDLTKTLLVMKLTGIFLLVTAIQVSARSTAQTVTYEAKKTPLAQVFAAVKEQTGYVFFYSVEDLEGTIPVTLKLRQVPLKEALEAILADQPLAFNIQGNTIAITRKAAVVGVNTNNAIAPVDSVMTVKGYIISEDGEALDGASIQVKGTQNGTLTKSNGEFSLKSVPSNSKLIVSFVGYEPIEIALGGRSSLRINLKHSKSELDQMVIKGYYATTNRLNTGDVSAVTSSDIEKQPVTDPILTLEGRIPGLYIQQTSGVPGAYSTIRIMGQNSIANGNDPLYIVDGVPYSSTTLTSADIGGGAVGAPRNGIGLGMSPFNSLNPNDIESIEVMKDADATAIYGSRGANGVILINTKKGKAGDTKIDINIYSGTGKVTRTMDLLNTQQYLKMRYEAINNDGLGSYLTPAYKSFFPDLLLWDTTRYTNWQKVLIGNPNHFTNAQLNISGGNANTQFFIGGGYSSQGTTFPGDYIDKKASVHFSLNNSSANGRVHVQLTASYVNDNSDIPSVDLTSKIVLAPDAPPLYDQARNLNWALLNGTYTWINPLAYTLQQAKAITNNLVSGANLSYTILPGLQLKANAGYSIQRMDQTMLQPASAEPPPYNNLASFRSSSFGTNQQQSWIIEPQLSFQRQILKGKLDVLAGSTFQQNSFSSISYGASGFPSDALIDNPAAASVFALAGNESTVYRYNALFGKVSYNLEDKYLVNFTARRDGSSRFGPGRQFGNFGAVGAAWIFSGEKWVSNGLPFLSFGKLRASYGSTGNDQIPDYQYLSTYTSSSTTYQGLTILTPTGLTNPYFSWEVVKKLQFSLDLGFAKDRILLSGTYYRNRDGNQLVGYPLPAVTGFTQVQANFPALVQNSGGEFSINTINIRSAKFGWTSSVNLTIPRNKLVSFPGIASTSYQYRYAVGRSLASYYAYHSTGVNSSNGQYQFYSAQNKGDTTAPSYPQDLVLSKPITQQYYGGLLNSFTYKGLKLDIFLQFVKQMGRNYYGSGGFQLPGTFNYNQPTTVMSRWQKPGDVTNIGEFSAYRHADPHGVLGASDFIFSDASFIRLKNISLSYELPAQWKKKAFLQNARVYLQAQNLFTITKYPGLDPETQGLNLPPLRMITGGIQLTL
jgi:TonB-linked SusC/RagA family outer membrane protein